MRLKETLEVFLPLSRLKVPGGDAHIERTGVVAYQLWVKKVVLVSLSAFSLKKFTVGVFAEPFLLGRKK